MKDLDGKVAVITGGGGGIGKAMGEAFAREGMKVVLSDVHQPSLDAAVDELRAGGADVIGVITDVSKLDSVVALRDATVDHFGGVHVVCNNAGVASGAHGRIWEHEINDWRYALSVHVYGVINGINAFVPWMLERGDEGHIVNTSSHNGGFAPVYSVPTYATCKAAVVTISECLFGQLREISSDIGVSVLFPTGKTQGILNTGIWTARERPPEYESEQPVDTTSKMQMWIDMKEAAGDPVQFTPLSEVADTVVDGLKANRFWMVEEGRFEELVAARADVILRRADPQYPIGA
ncbi:MAG: hypothetical protein AMXMBFR46_22600 [Acidimicrobiia bacterium]